MFYLLTIIVKILFFSNLKLFQSIHKFINTALLSMVFLPIYFFLFYFTLCFILYHLLLTATLSIIIWIIIIRFIITLFVHFSISTLNAARFFLATFEPSCWAFSTFAGIIWGEFVSIFQPMLLYSIPTNWPNQFIKSRFPLRI